MVDHDELLASQRFIVVSNRLPVVIKSHQGKPTISPASGGLITALEPLLKRNHGVWVGWSGTFEYSEDQVLELSDAYYQKVGYHLHPVMLTQEEVELFYEGFSNEILWPLFHDLQTECHFDPKYWDTYQSVNQKFADEVFPLIEQDDFVWIHDYHLMLMGQCLRQKNLFTKMSFFLHIPFAPLDIFLKIPWRFEILRGLLQYDFIGFQTKRDKRNFIHCVKMLLKDITIRKYENHEICSIDNREVYIGSFPISIDFQEFSNLSEKKEVAKEAKALKTTLNDCNIVFSVDRLDYTKGIPYRLDGIRRFLEKYPEMHGEVIFLQVVVPSRTHIREYHELKVSIDQAVSEINSEFTTPGWVPIHYMFYPLSREQLVAYYRAADAILVTPIKDGMNLVVKEYVASNVDETGVVILSEFAGAAAQMKEYSLLVNPYDVEGVADSIHFALNLPEADRKNLMKPLRKLILSEDIYHWIASIHQATHSSNDEDIPVSEEYIPAEN
jgi:alpha,alpha-trehalose-phosphate synthase [UDP-forming]